MSVLLLIPTVVRSPTAWRARWETALASVTTAPATVLCIGDSITEGQGSSTKSGRWIDRLTAFLQAKYNTGGVGGAGWVPIDPQVYPPGSTWVTYTSTSGTITQLTTVGTPGYRAISMATSASRTYTLTGTSVDIYWQRATSNGTFTWAVDGGSATSVSTAGTASATTKTTVTLGATVGASHTLTITATTGPVVLEGLFVYNGDETKGPRVWEASHTAWDTNDFMNHADYANFAAFITLAAPDLVMIQLGFNDYLHNTVNTTPSAYSTNLNTLMTTLTGLTKQPSIILIDSYDYGLGSSNPATQDDYRTVLLNLVSADPDRRTYLNFGDTMPPTDTTGAGYYDVDGVHPNDSGYTEITRQLSLAITPWAAPGPITATATIANLAYEISQAPTATVFATDTFTGTNGASWGSQWTITPNSGTATIQGNAGRLDPVVTTGYVAGPRAYLSGMAATANTDFLLSFTYQSAVEQYTFVAVRADNTVKADGFTPNNGYYLQLSPYSTNNYFTVNRVTGGSVLPLTDAGTGDPAFAPTVSTKYYLRFRVIGAVMTVTWWAAAGAEPSSPTWTYTDPSPYTTAGKVSVWNANGATGPCVLDIDDVTVTNGATSNVDPALTGPVSLSNWRTAVRDRAYRPATWLAIGDSITEGTGATARTNRWIDQALTSMRGSYPSAGSGAGYLPAYYSFTTWNPWTSRATGSGSLTDETGVGFGGRTTAIGPGATITYTITGSAMDVWWIAGGGTLTVTIDGGTASTISTAGTTGTGNHKNRFVFAAGGSHTVVIGASGSTTRFAGIQAFNGDEAVGIRVIEAAHSGWRTVDYTDSKYIDLWAAAAPDLVTISLGINDYYQSTTAATMKTNIQAFISNLRAALPNQPPSFAICVEWAPSGSTAVAAWAPYADAVRSIAQADDSIAVIDFYRALGYAAVSSGGNWASDGLHPSDVGHAFMGSQVANFLTAGTTPTPVGTRSSTALTHVGSTTWQAPASSTTIAPTYPASLATGDTVYAFLHTKPDTASIATPAGWESAWSATGGGGSPGIGTGPTRIDVFRLVVGASPPTGGSSQTFTITGGDSPLAFMRAYRASGTSLRFEEQFTTWSVPTASTAVGGTTTTTNMDLAALDELSVVFGTADDQSSTLTLDSVTASGVTFGTLTQAPTGTAVNAQGNDISAVAYRVPVTAGVSTATPVVGATASSTETAMGVILLVRATQIVPVSPHPHPRARRLLPYLAR